jgi:hypothetical protein
LRHIEAGTRQCFLAAIEHKFHPLGFSLGDSPHDHLALAGVYHRPEVVGEIERIADPQGIRALDHQVEEPVAHRTLHQKSPAADAKISRAPFRG